MAREVYSFAVTVPAGTSPSSPQKTALTMPPRVVQEVEVRLPPGPRGEVGWALGLAGQPIIPFQKGAWIVGDDERISWPLTGQPTSGAWELYAYNTGSFPHTIYITFLTDIVASSPTILQPLTIAA
jgi:hypothetical protein